MNDQPKHKTFVPPAVGIVYQYFHRVTEHDWPEDFADENGMYNNECVQCKTIFVGYKRRVVCKQCTEALEAHRQTVLAEPDPVEAVGEGTCKQSLQVGELPDQAVGATEPDFACDVCGNTPGEDGWLHHGKGCYVVGEDGGGDEYIQEADKHREQGELLPCPFCGGKAEIDTDGRMHFAACRICCAEGPSGIVSQATSLWNRRTTSAERELADLRKRHGDNLKFIDTLVSEKAVAWKRLKELEEQLAQAQNFLNQELTDWAATDTYCRAKAAEVLPAFEVYGDKESVPPIEAVVDKLVECVSPKRKEKENERC